MDVFQQDSNQPLAAQTHSTPQAQRPWGKPPKYQRMLPIKVRLPMM
jgi:hypothetical protein